MRHLLISALVLLPALASAKPVVKTIKKGKHTVVRHTDGSKTVIKTHKDGTTTSRNESSRTSVTEGSGYSHNEIVKEVVRHD